jgi:hypothetical protein
MVDTGDPPSDERKRAEFCKRECGIRRKLVNRRTFMIAVRIIQFVVSIAEIVNELLSDF